MKQTDLMIGDWVQFTYTPYGQNESRTIVFQVSEVENFSAAGLYFVCGVKYGRVCEVEKLQPIPLTAEILEKNGFDGEYKASYQIYESKEFDVMYISIWKNRLSIRKSPDIRQPHSSERLSITCNYVHELQHAFRLCGIEKEIEL